MTADNARPSRESVLDAFAVESEHTRATLQRYLELYPEYAGDLIDLSRELNRAKAIDLDPLSPADQALIDAVWSKHKVAVSTTAASLESLTVEDWRAVATELDVPRQVVTALREKRISLASIPRRFLRHLADATRSSIDQLEAFWSAGQFAGARSYKADGKPSIGSQTTFEQALIDAGVPAEKRAALLAEED
ncbi:MAG: hypothetical protein ACRCTG_06110 [Aestuariivirga sp.]